MIAMHTIFEAAKTRVCKSSSGGGGNRSADALLSAVMSGLKRKMFERSNITKNGKEMISTHMMFEGYIFSNKTVTADWHKFQTGKTNELFIFGLCGSGKTTIGVNIAKEANLPYNGTDDCPFDVEFSAFKQMSKKQQDKMMNDYYDCCEKKILHNKGILEGVGLFEVFNHRPKARAKILKTPCLILGLSALKSSIRAYKRSSKKIFDLHFIKLNFLEFQKEFNMVRKARLNVPGTVIKPFNNKQR